MGVSCKGAQELWPTCVGRCKVRRPSNHTCQIDDAVLSDIAAITVLSLDKSILRRNPNCLAVACRCSGCSPISARKAVSLM
eukprot:3256952-Amphidinium_carterae.2